ncbi:hypothetical protein [Blastococcus deserti]|uniref:Uncharacterized protein n=1 Tax=Blastococcus deserti TaxID=2259033 RepID=A0ABW4XBT1_9ACTN
MTTTPDTAPGSRLRRALRTDAVQVPSTMLGTVLALAGFAGTTAWSDAPAVVAVGLSIAGAALVGLGASRPGPPADTGAGSPAASPARGTAADQQAAEKALEPSARWRGLLFLVIGLVTGAIAAGDMLAADDLADRVAAALRLLAAAAACWAGWLLLRPPTSRWAGTGGGVASLFIVGDYWRLAFPDRWIDWRPSVAFVVTSVVLLAVVVALVVSWACDPWVNPLPRQKWLARQIEVGLAVLALVGTLLAAVLQIGGGWYTTTHNPAQTHPNLTITVDFGEATELPDLTVVPVRIGIRNGGQMPLDLLMTQYTVVGFDLRAGGSTDRPFRPWEPLVGMDGHEFVESQSRTADQVCPTVLQYGRVTETRTNLGPGEEKSSRVLVSLVRGHGGPCGPRRDPGPGARRGRARGRLPPRRRGPPILDPAGDVGTLDRPSPRDVGDAGGRRLCRLADPALDPPVHPRVRPAGTPHRLDDRRSG